jgi:uroporphyrinogen decarboxylase
LLSKLTDVAIDYLSMQVRAGVQAVQIFDTWIGLLSATDFRQLALPYLRRIFDALEPLGVPRIYFGNGAGHFLTQLADTGADVLSLDWRTDIGAAFKLFSEPTIPLQGNLDPCALFGSREQVESATRSLLEVTQGRPHIFNLGHGVQPDTPYDNVKALVDTVHAHPSNPRQTE